jgi:cytochrome P450
MHQDIQEKLYEEIATHWSTDINSYDVLMSKLTYMDSFVREVFRIHPVAIHVVHRQCMEDTDVAGYDVRKGCI